MFGLTPYRYRRPVNGRAGTLAQWQLLALAAAWGLMVIAVYLNIAVHS